MSKRWETIGCVLAVLTAAGCSTTSTPTRAEPVNPAPATATSASPAATSAAPTAPGPTSPSAPNHAAPTSAAAPSDPASVVEEYFAAINDHDYARAWALGGDHLGSSYARFAAGFADTAQDTVTILSVSGGDVAVDLTATNTDGSQQLFSGTYTVAGQAIGRASISQVQAIPNGTSLCGAPANPYGYNLCGNGHLVKDPPVGICTYFDCIDNFWNGRGYMVECEDGRYSMSGGISGACRYHGGESSPVSSR